jgi:hypothetical protein
VYANLAWKEKEKKGDDRYLDICAFKPLGNIAFVVSCLEIYVVNFLSHLLPTLPVMNMKLLR